MILIATAGLYLLALINPVSKIFLLASMEPPLSGKKLLKVTLHATCYAFVILLVLTLMGKFLLNTVFHVDLYSLKLAGGVILFIIGLNAVRNGVFYEKTIGDDLNKITIVPLATPLIAGPGVITASISYSSQFGIKITLPAIIFALLINLLLMFSSVWIRRSLEQVSAIGPLIRITGLIVSAVAVQMMLEGAGEWLRVTIPSIKHN